MAAYGVDGKTIALDAYHNFDLAYPCGCDGRR